MKTIKVLTTKPSLYFEHKSGSIMEIIEEPRIEYVGKNIKKALGNVSETDKSLYFLVTWRHK